MDNNNLIAHLEDLAVRADKVGSSSSKFLTPGERVEAEQAFSRRRNIDLSFEGGFEEAERTVAVFTNPDWGGYAVEDFLTALEIKHRPQDEIRHQDILGSVLGLGLTREVIGDILLESGRAYLVCLASIADFILSELEKIGRIGVTVTAIPLEKLPILTTELTEKQVTVASLRLDAVLAAAFNFSRADAAEAIEAGLVKLSHKECENTSKTIEQGEILSLRGRGRVKFLSLSGETRKGRIRLNIGYYPNTK